MKKRMIAIVITLATSLSMLAGCGKYDDTSLDVTMFDVDKYVDQVGNYKGLTIETTEKNVITDEYVEQYINYLLARLGTDTKEVDRAAVNGDTVNIDYAGFKDGVQFDGGTAEGFDLTLGSGTFIPGFEEGLIGYKAGDEVSLDLTFPENYGKADLAGAAVVFEVKVNVVKEQVLPELNEENIAKFGMPVKTVDEFRTYVKEQLIASAESTYESTKRNNALSQVYETSTFKAVDVPETLKNYYVTQLEASDRLLAEDYALPLEQFVTGYYNMTFEDYEAQANERAVLMVQDAILCEKIARTEGIKITDAEVEEEMLKAANDYGYDTIEDFKANVDTKDYKNYLIEIKVADYIIANGTVVDVPAASEE